MSARNQKLVRKHFVSIVDAALVDSSLLSEKPLMAIYDHMPPTFDGDSPVMLVLKDGIQRPIAGMGTAKFDNNVHLRCQIFVAAADANIVPPVTAQDVDDLSDDVEAAVADLVAANQYVQTKWRALRYSEKKSLVLDILYVDGSPYKMEEFYLEVEAPDDV